MPCRRASLPLLAVLGSAAPPAALAQSAEPSHVPVHTPRLWDDAALRDWALPVAALGVAPAHMPAADYYALPVDNLRTYPVYHPDREPPGYLDEIRRRGPQPLVDPTALDGQPEAVWIETGRRVFDELDSWFFRTSDPDVIAHFRSAKSIDATRDDRNDRITADGILPVYRWVVDRDGVLNISLQSCGSCHHRIDDTGHLVPGGPPNYSLAENAAVSHILGLVRDVPGVAPGELFYASFGVPWLAGDVHERYRKAPGSEIGRLFSLPTGAPENTTFDRINGSPFFATRLSDLRGVRHRRFLDATATHRNRGPEDIARYGILVEVADTGVFGEHRLSEALPTERYRPEDAAMYALALYLWSTERPRPAAPPSDLARRGQAVFEAEGCHKCHSPPHYTNNELVRAPGFDPVLDAPPYRDLPIMRRRVDTDPGLALRTRKGTGLYKVPSLRGVRYRELLGHSGSVKRLEDWFDPARLEEDYVPTGWRGPGVERRAVPGHEFGLDLEPADKRALLAFLRTL